MTLTPRPLFSAAAARRPVFFALLRSHPSQRQAIANSEPLQRRQALRLIWRWKSISATEAERLGLPFTTPALSSAPTEQERYLEVMLRRALEILAIRTFRNEYYDELAAFSKSNSAGFVSWREILHRSLDSLEDCTSIPARKFLLFRDPQLLIEDLHKEINKEIDILLLPVAFDKYMDLHRIEHIRYLKWKFNAVSDMADDVISEAVLAIIRQGTLRQAINESQVRDFLHSSERKSIKIKRLKNLILMRLKNEALNEIERRKQKKEVTYDSKSQPNDGKSQPTPPAPPPGGTGIFSDRDEYELLAWLLFHKKVLCVKRRYILVAHTLCECPHAFAAHKLSLHVTECGEQQRRAVEILIKEGLMLRSSLESTSGREELPNITQINKSVADLEILKTQIYHTYHAWRTRNDA